MSRCESNSDCRADQGWLCAVWDRLRNEELAPSAEADPRTLARRVALDLTGLPLEPERLWEKLYTGSCMNGRRGAVICAMGALDMAMWDIRGKAAGKPCWQLLGEPREDLVVPYASLQPMGESFEEYRDSLVAWAVKA